MIVRQVLCWNRALERDEFASAHPSRSRPLFERVIQTSGGSAFGHHAPVTQRRLGLRPYFLTCWIGALLTLAACGTPIQVERLAPSTVHRELTKSVISSGQLSEPTQIVLDSRGLSKVFAIQPEAAIAVLHRDVAEGLANADVWFALSELSFRHAEDSGKRPYYLAASVYAFGFLFPNNLTERPTAFDPRFRTACDIYNRSLTSSFVSADRLRVDLHSGRFDLPFGTLDITFDPAGAHWGGIALSNFTPADELGITGLRDRYRRAGLGASLAADARPRVQEAGFQVEPSVKVPATALLQIDLSQYDLSNGRLHGRITVAPAFEPSSVDIRGESVPLETDTSAAFAYSLSDPKVWESEVAGFLDGDFFHQTAPQLVGLEPYRPGQIPVVFIHGTASSSGRWANLINDLQGDPVIRERYQFWSFSYASGTATPFSALQLRTAIEEAVRKLDPHRRDRALREMVLIGHSQGGLIAKLLVINSGSRLWDSISTKPLDELRISTDTRDLLRRALFVTPVPEVRRVIFIATPHHGSFVAGSTIAQLLARLVTPPSRLVAALQDVTHDNPGALRDASSIRLGSVWTMTPTNPALVALSKIPVSPNVAAHSIIAVQGNGPIDTGDDGVVSYRSAHIDEAVSELVIRSDHSVQANPYTLAEVRRILLLHLNEVCSHDCRPIRTDSEPVANRPTGDLRRAGLSASFR
jgi:pimeloyl-ACP methyl ester carboxylesterase